MKKCKKCNWQLGQVHIVSPQPVSNVFIGRALVASSTVTLVCLGCMQYKFEKVTEFKGEGNGD